MQANGMIFWDWNGTLMDDVDFTHSCLNWMLETHGYPQRYDLAAYREIFGFPIEEYYIRAGFNFAKHPYAELAERFMEYYNAGVDACPPSAHAAETLAELSRQGWRQSVLSASRRDYLIEQVAARGLQGYFTELLGLADIYGVSKVQVGKQWLAQSGIAPAACVMVGDTQHDAEVAKALGTKCVLYTGGHQSARGSRLCARMSSTIWHSCRSCWKPYNVHLTTSDLQKSEVFFVLAGLPSQSRIRSPAPPKGEPLAKPETLRGLPRPPTLGEVDATSGSRRRGRGCSPPPHIFSFYEPPSSANLQKIHSKSG